jgi:hypothetical protein
MTRYAIRFAATAFSVAVAVGLLTACSSNKPFLPSSSPAAINEMPQWSNLATLVPPQLRPLPGTIPLPLRFDVDSNTSSATGIYASEVYGIDIWGYPINNSHNGKAICTVTPVSGLNGIAVDGNGDLIDPDGGTSAIIVFKGPQMCGPELGSVKDPFGQPSDAASANAATGTIVVANIFDNNRKPGSVSRCTLAGGCKANLKNPNMYEVAGVALATNGDCWASANNSSGKATLTYFKGCSGPGKKTTGYRNAYYGGLDIDGSGNLVSLSYMDKKLYVYKGCNPACARVGGPFVLKGQATFGHLNASSTQFATGDFQYGQIDVYKYAPTKVKFAYSFNNGLNASALVEGIAYDPR